ncbi:MAG: hypothetical protein JWO30_2078 [Fibrobacteres bacterium]|nr:hypothetical protein [Fibrobacterota bacterium]
MNRRYSLFAFGPLALFASLLTVGCEQASDTAGPASVNTGAAVPVIGPPDADGNVVYKDVSESEGKLAVPLILADGGAMPHVDPGMLVALRKSYLSRGNPYRAEQLESSYDFNSGDFKGDPVSLSMTAAGLKKGSASQWWTNGYIRYRIAINGAWLGFVGNDQWAGDPTNLYAPGVLGLNITSQIENGVTPQLSWGVLWNNGAGWTSLKGWNADHSSGNAAVWMQGLRASTTYPNYSVCYGVTYRNAGSIGTPVYACSGSYLSVTPSEFIAVKLTVTVR